MAEAQQLRQAPEWGELGIVPSMVLRMFGMRRSGNHAIANWLLRNAPDGQSVFLNNCRPHRSPLKFFASIDVNGSYVPQKKAAADLPGFAAPAGDGALLLFSYEDVSPADFKPPAKVSGPFDASLIDKDILVYRGFLNWCASLLKKLQGNEAYSVMFRTSVVLKTVHGYSRLLDRVEAGDPQTLVPICYDDWFASESYREAILAKLGLDARDNDVGTVQRFGGGSSFQKDTKDAQALGTAERWKQMENDPEFILVLLLVSRDETLMGRLRRIFPKDAEILAGLPERAVLPKGISV